jgi:Uma2 family endonuclease
MPASAVRRATYEDVLAAPEHMIAEVIFGTLYTQPRPATTHQRASSRLGILLGRHFDIDDEGPTGWLLLDEPELHLGNEPDILVPDLAGWRQANVTPEMEDTAWIGVAPDWVCEVLSPSTQVRDRGIKLDIYLRERVGHVWIIDPILETLEIYGHGGDHWRRCAQHAGNVTVRAEPFESFDLELGRLWKRRVVRP